MRELPEWSDWRPRLLAPRWVLMIGWGAFLVTFFFAAVNNI